MSTMNEINYSQDCTVNGNFKTLKQIYATYNDDTYYDDVYIENYSNITDYILNLYNDNIKFNNCYDLNKLLWNVNYYKDIKPNYNEMKKYYLMAIDVGSSDAMLTLAHYYHNIEKNCDEMKKYYLMAIDLGNSDAMFNLGRYYHYIEKDYNETKKYYLMAIELGNSNAMNNLGNYYEDIEKDYDKMKKYYLMAIELGNDGVIRRCKQNNYYYDNDIKNKILYKPFKIIEEEIMCPITLEKTNKCFITNCNHKFSDEIVNCLTCPLCRNRLCVL